MITVGSLILIILPIGSFDAIKLNITASSLTVAVTYKGDTVAIIATQSGELKKVKPLNIYMFEKKRHFLIRHKSYTK